MPRGVEAAVENHKEVYYVTFGRLIVHFTDDGAGTWFAANECPRRVLGPDGRCTCAVANDAE